MTDFSIRSVFDDSYSVMNKNVGRFIKVFLLYGIVLVGFYGLGLCLFSIGMGMSKDIVGGADSAQLAAQSDSAAVLGFFLGGLALIMLGNILYCAFYCGSAKMCLDAIDDKEKFGFSSFRMGWRNYVYPILAWVLVYAAIMAIVIISFWACITFSVIVAAFSMLFILPLFIAVFYMSVRLFPLVYVIIEWELGPVEGIRQAWQLTKGNMFTNFKALAYIGWVCGIPISIASICISLNMTMALVCLGVQLLWMIYFSPLSSIFTANLYRYNAYEEESYEESYEETVEEGTEEASEATTE